MVWELQRGERHCPRGPEARALPVETKQAHTRSDPHAGNENHENQDSS